MASAWLVELRFCSRDVLRELTAKVLILNDEWGLSIFLDRIAAQTFHLESNEKMKISHVFILYIKVICNYFLCEV